MTFIFVLRYPYPRKGALRGRVGGIEGVLSPITNIMCYVNSGVFNSGESKNGLYFHFRVTPTPTRARGGIPPKIKCYVNSRVSIVGISKMISIFILGYPKPPKGRPQGGLGGQRGFSPLLPKIMCYIDSGVLN